MSRIRTALAAQQYADSVVAEDFDALADAYRVAADAWLEAGEPEHAAHQLLRAAEYHRWALDDRGESGVPGGIARSAIDMSTGWVDPFAEWQWRYRPVLSIDEAAEIARLAGWLQPYRGKLKYVGRLGVLPPSDKNGRLNESRLRWLFLLTDSGYALGTSLETFREILASHLERRGTADRDARPRRAGRGRR